MLGWEYAWNVRVPRPSSAPRSAEASSETVGRTPAGAEAGLDAATPPAVEAAGMVNPPALAGEAVPLTACAAAGAAAGAAA